MGSENVGIALVTVIGVVCGIVFVVLVAGLPGHVARKRGHPSAKAIQICGLLGLLFLPCWFVALIWAYTGSDNTPPAGEPDYHYAPPEWKRDVPQALSRRERERSAREEAKAAAYLEGRERKG
jgi:apolipoprotein N-acyltransferase